VDDHFSHGTVQSYWGGSSNAATHLDAMHYCGMLSVARRNAGIRFNAAHQHQLGPTDAAGRGERMDQQVDAAVRIYAPLPSASLSFLLRRLRNAAPRWHGELKGAVQRAKERLSHTRIDGVDWYWPTEVNPVRYAPPETARLLAPFDLMVWDRDRFELLWGWKYRFEAYTPAPKRKLGYYALPLLWRDCVIGWALSVKNGELQSEFGYIESRPPRNADIRLLVRKEGTPTPKGVEVAIGDLLDPVSVQKALDGVDKLYLLNAVTPDELTQGLIAYDLAKRLKLKHCLSLGLPCGPLQGCSTASKIAVENALREFDVPFTIIRPNYFGQNDATLKDALTKAGIYPMPLGQVGVSAVDIRDIAEATAIALISDGHLGKPTTSPVRRR